MYQPSEIIIINVDVRNLGIKEISNISIKLEILDPFEKKICSEDKTIRMINPGETKQFQMSWKAPEGHLSAFVARALVMNYNGKVITSDHYVFDVVKDWIQVPRYGFFTTFSTPEDIDKKIEQMAEFHINAIQFYDWFEYHGNYTPIKSEYTILNKPIIRNQVIKKIKKAQEIGMKAMAYTAIYAAAEPIYKEHPEWALRDKFGKPLKFENWLYFMNPGNSSGWHDFLMKQFIESIKMFNWDGIHLDQYGKGWTENAYWNETRVDMEKAFLTFINDAINEIRKYNPRLKLIFNLVNAWPYETIAKYSMSDAIYIEVWPPWNTYADIQKLIQIGKTYTNKAIILAAYTPNHLPTILLLDATIFANQGFHIELGEGNGILIDPYFPKYATLSEDAEKALKIYYECITRYEAYIYDKDIQRLSEENVNISIYESSSIPKLENILVIPYSKQINGKEQAKIIHLVNFIGIPTMSWKTLQQEPKNITNIPIEVKISRESIKNIEGVYFITPDRGNSDPILLNYMISDFGIKFTIPSLKYWDIIIIKFF
jgi:dextranase